jgi:hypothetical protein
MGDGSDRSDELVQALRQAFADYAAALARRPPTQHARTAADVTDLLVLLRKTAHQLGVDLAATGQETPATGGESATR